MIAYLTQLSSPFSQLLANAFRQRNIDVVSGILSDTDTVIDFFVATENNPPAGDTFDVINGIDSKLIMDTFSHLVSAPVVALNQVLPFMGKSDMKRICFLSSSLASINMCAETTGYAYNMSKAALHMILSVAWNHYQPEDYSFRLYDPMTQGQMDHRVTAEIAAETFVEYCVKERAYDPPNMRKERNDERLIMRDALGREWPW